MTELTDLAEKYARQLDAVDDLRRTIDLAEANLDRETHVVEATRVKIVESAESAGVWRREGV